MPNSKKSTRQLKTTDLIDGFFLTDNSIPEVGTMEERHGPLGDFKCHCGATYPCHMMNAQPFRAHCKKCDRMMSWFIRKEEVE